MRKTMSHLLADDVHAILSEFFPRKNDDAPSTYVEELSELKRFGVRSAKQLRNLLSKWSIKIMEIDASPMSARDSELYKESLGDDFVTKRVEADYWFAYPGLLRLALELEFGKSYEKYSYKRDSATSSAEQA
jgi:hypothetical protein